VVLMLPGHNACHLEGGIAGAKGIVYFVQNQILVVLVVRITRRT
jgi:hypothetical protein